MEQLNIKNQPPKIAQLALGGLHFVAERLRGGAWAALADTCVTVQPPLDNVVELRPATMPPAGAA